MNLINGFDARGYSTRGVRTLPHCPFNVIVCDV